MSEPEARCDKCGRKSYILEHRVSEARVVLGEAHALYVRMLCGVCTEKLLAKIRGWVAQDESHE